MSEKLDLFMILKDINFDKSYQLHKHVDFQKQYNDYMINSFLSMSPETVLEANCMNIHYSLPKHVKYLFLSDVIEKKNRFLKYIKSDVEKADNDMIKYMMQIYKVNKEVATNLLKTTSKEEQETIKNIFTQKTIRKR